MGAATPMKIVVALDKFKGTLSAAEACGIVAEVCRRHFPQAAVLSIPMADGGEGTAVALVAAWSGEWVSRLVFGPLPGQKVSARFANFPGRRIAVVEMAQASGLFRVPREARNPWVATTFGAGELVAAAAELADEIWLAVGGSATVDGGVGAAMALGWKFFDRRGVEVGLGAGALEKIVKIVRPAMGLRCAVRVLCDVTNPLLGELGAARVFGPQKGADGAMVVGLERGLAHLADRVEEEFGFDIRRVAGGGAAGGLAAGAVVFMGAELAAGVDVVSEAVGLREAMRGADVVITGEGCLDSTSLGGKVVSGVLRATRVAGARVAVFSGQSLLSVEEGRAAGIAEVVTLVGPGVSQEMAMERAGEVLRMRAEEWAKRVEAGRE